MAREALKEVGPGRWLLLSACQEQRQGEELRQKQMREEQRLGELEGPHRLG